MNNQIQVVSGFKCTLCNTISHTEQDANICFKVCTKRVAQEQKALEEQRQKDEFVAQIKEREMVLCREVSSKEDMEILLRKYAKEYLDIDIDFLITSWKFQERISNTNDCPFNGVKNWEKHKDKPTSYPGINISFNAKLNGSKPHKAFDLSRMFSERDSSKSSFIKSFPNKPDFNKGFYSSFESGLIHHFAGLHCSARTTSAWNDTTNVGVSGNGHIFIDDFPKIKEQYERFLVLKSQKKFYDDALNHLMGEHRSFVVKAINGDESLIEMRNLYTSLSHQLIETQSKINSRESQITLEYSPLKEEMIRTVDESKELDFGKEKQQEYVKMFQTFKQ